MTLGLGGIVRQAAEPFALGHWVEDWQARAARLGAISDYYTLRARDDAFFEARDDGLGAPFGSRARLRRAAHACFPAAWEQTEVGYAFDTPPAVGLERALFEALYAGVDSVEKMAMSCIARALCRFEPPVPQLLALCNVLYEEALHLKALTSLLELRQEAAAWITPRRQPFWELTGRAESLLEYVLLQHCLSEVEGCVSAGESVFRLNQAGLGGTTAVAVAARIHVEETGHALAGYQLLKELDEGRDAAFFRDVIGRYLEVERVQPDGPKALRQRFSLFVAERYVRTRSLTHVRALILEESRAWASHGAPRTTAADPASVDP